MTNPLRILLDDRLSAVDTGVMSHGFAKHGRDYIFILEDSVGRFPGTYKLTLTHVVALNYETGVRPEVWQHSWADEFTDYARWRAAGEPNGYVFGTDWSLAYPGFEAPENHPEAASWSEKLQRPMYAAAIETDRFKIALIFHGVHLEKISDEALTVSQVTFPL